MEVINPRTNRFVKLGSQNYKRLVREGIIVPEQPDTVENTPSIEPEPEFDESLLQKKMANISTDMIQKNMKKIVKAQKLSDKDTDLLLKKMLYKKLCVEEKPPKKKQGKKKKFKVVQPSSSESSDDSD